jgi:hypothetical protein
MKRIFLAAMVVMLALLAGCYFPETIETRIVFDDDDLPIVIIKYHNISSGAEEPDDLKESFDDLMKDMYGEKYLVDRAVEGLAIRKRHLEINNNQLHAEIVGDAKDLNNLYDFFVSGDERFLVYDGEDSYELIETNGKIIKTERNTLIVWPDEMKEIYWTQRLQGFDSDEDSKLFTQNIAKMVAMFREYQKKHNKE